MFIGREAELNELETRLGSKKFEMIPIYGRRRVGKTRLVEEFAKDKNCIFFTAGQVGEEENLTSLSQAINLVIKPYTYDVVYPSFEKAFEVIANYVNEASRPVIFIIDEYPYLAKSSTGVSSILQRVIDKKYLHLDNLMLILTGSSMSFMEEQVLGYESPLYGRRTGQIKLSALNYKDSKAFMPHYDDMDFLTIYGITAGIPLYLSMMDENLSLKENIIEHVLRKNSFLYEEPSNLLMQELRTPNKYNDIIKAIATGSTEPNEISDKAGVEANKLTNYLKSLMELNIVEKQFPLTRIAKRKPIYKISDGLFRFWYRYAPKYRNFIESGKSALIWKEIEEDLPVFTSFVFEEVCRKWILEKNGENEIPFLVSEVGSWWGNNPLIKNSSAQAEEVDIIGIGLDEKDLLVGECKWQNKPVDYSVAEKLIYRSGFFPYHNKALFIFSKMGFTDSLIEYASMNNLNLIKFCDM